MPEAGDSQQGDPLFYQMEGIKRIAQRLKVSQRTVQQALKERHED